MGESSIATSPSTCVYTDALDAWVSLQVWTLFSTHEIARGLTHLLSENAEFIPAFIIPHYSGVLIHSGSWRTKTKKIPSRKSEVFREGREIDPI